jgi:hypothetical protein
LQPSGGNVLVGTQTNRGRITVEASSGDLVHAFSVNALTGYVYNTVSTTTSNAFYCIKNGVEVGRIICSSSATTFATTSDYRLKENVAPMTGALEKITALKPCTYTWKVDGSAGQGFIAHELQAVVPDCVAGEKDAIDKDGKPQYQGVDTSFLVATLVAAIQELTARLEVLENK